IQFARLAEASEVDGSAVDTCRAVGAVTSRRLGFEEFPLWSVRSELAPGAALVWDGRHGDEGLYALQGGLVVDGRVWPEGGGVVGRGGAGGRRGGGGGGGRSPWGPGPPPPLRWTACTGRPPSTAGASTSSAPRATTPPSRAPAARGCSSTPPVPRAASRSS